MTLIKSIWLYVWACLWVMNIISSHPSSLTICHQISNEYHKMAALWAVFNSLITDDAFGVI